MDRSIYRYEVLICKERTRLVKEWQKVAHLKDFESFIANPDTCREFHRLYRQVDKYIARKLELHPGSANTKVVHTTSFVAKVSHFP